MHEPEGCRGAAVRGANPACACELRPLNYRSALLLDSAIAVATYDANAFAPLRDKFSRVRTSNEIESACL